MTEEVYEMEYEKIHKEYGLSKIELDNLGSQGWDLVSVIKLDGNYIDYYLKRVKQLQLQKTPKNCTICSKLLTNEYEYISVNNDKYKDKIICQQCCKNMMKCDICGKDLSEFKPSRNTNQVYVCQECHRNMAAQR